jgi:hypothetical protein
VIAEMQQEITNRRAPLVVKLCHRRQAEPRHIFAVGLEVKLFRFQLAQSAIYRRNVDFAVGLLAAPFGASSSALAPSEAALALVMIAACRLA